MTYQTLGDARCADPTACTAPCHDDDGVRYCDICGLCEAARVPGKTPSMQAAALRAPAQAAQGTVTDDLKKALDEVCDAARDQVRAGDDDRLWRARTTTFERLRDSYEATIAAALAGPAAAPVVVPEDVVDEIDVRGLAVAAVDSIHGFTMEFATSPAQHAAEYDAAEIGIRLALASDPGFMGQIRSLLARHSAPTAEAQETGVQR